MRSSQRLEIHAIGRAATREGGAGGTGEPGGAIRTTVQGGAVGARNQAEADWSMGKGDQKADLSSIVEPPNKEQRDKRDLELDKTISDEEDLELQKNINNERHLELGGINSYWRL